MGFLICKTLNRRQKTKSLLSLHSHNFDRYSGKNGLTRSLETVEENFIEEFLISWQINDM